MKITHKKNYSGFTLIELLIVIAILTILAVVVLVLIDPVEKFALVRDADRETGVAQIGRALATYFVDNANYPDPSSWDTQLIGPQILKSIPEVPPYSINNVVHCVNNARPIDHPTFCYDYDFDTPDNGAIVYVRLEAGGSIDSCASGNPYFIYSTIDARAGTICSDVEPTPWPKGTQTYLE